MHRFSTLALTRLNYFFLSFFFCIMFGLKRKKSLAGEVKALAEARPPP